MEKMDQQHEQHLSQCNTPGCWTETAATHYVLWQDLNQDRKQKSSSTGLNMEEQDKTILKICLKLLISIV